mgnify:FL=1|jgi:hypothetical protein
MKTEAYEGFDKLTSRNPVIEILHERREELRRLLVKVIDQTQLSRIQGMAAEVDLMLAYLENTIRHADARVMEKGNG